MGGGETASGLAGISHGCRRSRALCGGGANVGGARQGSQHDSARAGVVGKWPWRGTLISTTRSEGVQSHRRQHAMFISPARSGPPASLLLNRAHLLLSVPVRHTRPPNVLRFLTALSLGSVHVRACLCVFACVHMHGHSGV